MTRKEKQEIWIEIVSKQKVSGQNISQWCRENDVNMHNFRYWTSRISTLNQQIQTIQAPRWTALTPKVSATSSITSLKLLLGSISIEVEKGFDPELLEDVILILSSHV